MKKRIISALLSFLMIVSIIPAFALSSLAADSTSALSDGANYLSFPITLRDYAADGMFFEWNEISANTTYESVNYSTTAVYPGSYNTDTWSENSYSGVRVVGYSSTFGTSLPDSYEWWICIIVDGSGNILYVFENGSTKDVYTQIMTDTNCMATYAIWCWVGDTTGGYTALSQITSSNIGVPVYNDAGFVSSRTTGVGDYSKIDVSGYVAGTDSYIYLYQNTQGDAPTMHQANNLGFGLLQTNDNSYLNNLPGNAGSITGSQYINNGTYNSSDVPEDLAVVLNSGITQTAHGGLIRPDLVESTLGANGKPVYISTAVDYMAALLQQMLQVDYENDDGSVNNYFIMGAKLYNDAGEFVGPIAGTKDLAQVFRDSIEKAGLNGYVEYGYTKAKAKFEAGGLTKPTDCTTYYEIAYFIMHSTFTDNDGYGTVVDEYEYINLKEVQNDDGTVKYVFNSAYDDTVYDPVNGIIYNTQTDNITARVDDSGNDVYTRGHKQPEWTFNPLYVDGVDYGYGRNGNVYEDNAISYIDTGNGTYYEKTNYNLTLEGHGKFVYNTADNLYFTFTGDDDVYLYIDGTRVLDLGGAHSISACTISLNDVAAVLGMQDGGVYDFDFFYMERHGTAANFGIETNIKVVDPSIVTDKLAYQHGAALAQGAYIDAKSPVTYEFHIKNTGGDAIENLTFSDPKLGVYLTKDSITLNSETDFSDLFIRVREFDAESNEYGRTIKYVGIGDVTESILEEMLEDGIGINETFEIYGFNYTIPEDDWDNISTSTGKDEWRFINKVDTTAVSVSSQKNLSGFAECFVQRFEYPIEPLHVYEWTGKSVTITEEDLIANLQESLRNNDSLTQQEKDAAVYIETSNTDFVLCDALGNTDAYLVNPNVTVDANGNFVFTGVTSGVDVFYYQATVRNQSTNVPTVFNPAVCAVYSYDAQDDNIVLDYGLPVNLTAEGGITENDTILLPRNPYETEYAFEIVASESTSDYGLTVLANNTLTYTMNKFMSGEDTIKLNVSVQEKDATGDITKFNGVEMNETVTVLPANSVYYEDDFASIIYNDDLGWNAGSASTGVQSPDQSINYGNDPFYQKDQNNSLDSHGNVHTLNVPEMSSDVAFSFEFTGTGFDLISRTTVDTYAVIAVLVYKVENGVVANDFTYALPVITESKGGDLYQIPVIKMRDIDYGTYKVVVNVAGSTAEKTRVLFLDGIKIYKPYQDTSKYLASEQNVTVLNVKEQIEDNSMAYCTINSDGSTLGVGNTLVENTNGLGDFVLVDAADRDDYIKNGPNNEIYFSGESNTSVIAFYIEKDANVEDTNRTIQIAVHRKAVNNDKTALSLVYGSTAEQIHNAAEGDSNYISVASGTEIYYTIDVANLTEVDGKYLVLIGTKGGDAFTAVLAMTNIKLSGYTVCSDIELEVTDAVNLMNAASSPVLSEAIKLQEISKQTTFIPNDVVVNDELTVLSANADGALTVVTTAGAEKISVLDMFGNEVEILGSTKSVGDDTVTFVAEISLTAGQTYTVRAFDANGNASVNKLDVFVD